MTGSAKVLGFPGAAQVPTVGQRICPLMSQAVLVNGQPGQITAQCAGVACRLWELCNGSAIERLIEAVVKVVEEVRR